MRGGDALVPRGHGDPARQQAQRGATACVSKPFGMFFRLRRPPKTCRTPTGKHENPSKPMKNYRKSMKIHENSLKILSSKSDIA